MIVLVIELTISVTLFIQAYIYLCNCLFNVNVFMHTYYELCFDPGYNSRILHTAQNCGDGYTSKVLDCNLGYTSTVIFNGNYIFAAKFKVRKLLISYNYVAI